ncbi:hypothetical protein [Acinetobacter baumannii]|uniref:hypothetical protein n=1 Tax=Acinetobacter baumannii TaxID=470 RepID=UPI0011277D1B|nr:hypothetical protein [Acinetobacter baumannii]TPS40987.1 hypothetical protein FJU40_09290 [Acinetobacter baumannii]
MNGLKRAKILSYNAKGRTAQVHIHGLTDGASEGITATFAYPVGDSDLDTEPYRVCRRVNILRDYPDDKTKLYPRN